MPDIFARNTQRGYQNSYMEGKGSVTKHNCQQFLPTIFMEGDLSKKSIHINESFVHAIYIGIVVNSYSDIVAYI